MRSSYYNSGKYYQMIPVHRQQVAPGASMSLTVSARFRGGEIQNPTWSGGLATLAAFYVPNRILWGSDPGDLATSKDGLKSWEEFITNGDEDDELPMAPNGIPFLYENTSDRVTVFARRAYKLIQNRFFGEKDYTASWYTDPFNDASLAVKRCRIEDGILGSLTDTGDMRTETMSLPVAANAATLDMSALRRSLMKNREEQKEDFGPRADAYNRAMRRMGVQLGWKNLQEPQLLGSKKQRFNARSLTSTGDTAFGKTVSRFVGQVTLRTGRKMFKEHGQILVCLVVKPDLFHRAAHSPPDVHMVKKFAHFQGKKGADGVLRPVRAEHFNANWITADEDFHVRPDWAYKAGSRYVGVADATKHFVPTFERDGGYGLVRYPEPMFPEEYGAELAVMSNVSAALLHPRGS